MMDPDIPAPSIEADDNQPEVLAKRNARQVGAPASTHLLHLAPSQVNIAATVPLPPSSPQRTPAQTPRPASQKTFSPSPRPPSRSPSATVSSRDWTRSTPPLTRKRSTPNLIQTQTQTPKTPHYRRTSSSLKPSSPSPASSAKMGSGLPPERPPVTAATVAQQYFAKELDAHRLVQSDVAVIVHDSCYGHRFSRPRSTKNALATIVERPERIHATLLGAAAAYVRLGGRHAEGSHPPTPEHDPSTVCHVPFHIRKTSRSTPLTHPSVAFVHGSKWMEELQIMCDTAEGKLTLNGKELVRPIGYGKDENGKALPKLHEGDLYLCAESLAALQGCLGGVCDAVDTVFSSTAMTRRAFVCIRPPGHHCSANYPSGFCWLNNVHVGIAYAAMNHGLTHAAIIDFDLHHGDGSQDIAWHQNRKAHGAAKNAAAHKKTPIGYYSLHDINSYPCEWGDEEKVRNASLCIENAHGQSIWNVHLESWKTQADFWKLYEAKYTVLLEKARAFLRGHAARMRESGAHPPKAAIFISAGFDASEWEGAGMQRHKVNVPTEFYARFTADIVNLSREHDLAVDSRVISLLEGGYSDRALTSGVLSHLCGLAGHASAPPPDNVPINHEATAMTPGPDGISNVSVDRDWWAVDQLEDLEAVVAGRSPAPPKASRDKTGNYSSPTQASTLKMTDQARQRHSLNALQVRLSLESDSPLPPPPDVDWTVAAYELSRVLIPSDRQTSSCTHEDLNAEALKARRERQSAVGAAAIYDRPMQLRDRKAKPPAAPSGGSRPPSRSGSRPPSRSSNRRTTIAAVSDLSDLDRFGADKVNGRPRRRSSDASSILSSFQDMKLSENNERASRGSSAVPEKLGRPVAAKKAKPGPAPRPAARARSSPKSSPRKAKSAAPPVPEIPAALRADLTATLAQAVAEGSGVPQDASASSHEGTTVPSHADNVENLSNGIKKIHLKLRVPKTDEATGPNQVKAADNKPKKPRLVKKPLVPKNTKVIKPVADTPPSILALPGSKAGQIEPMLPVTTSENADMSRESMTIPSSEALPTMSDSTDAGTSPATTELPPLFPAAPPPVPAQGNVGQLADGKVPHPEELAGELPDIPSAWPRFEQPSLLSYYSSPLPALPKHISPDTGSLTRRTKEDLPVFTSQSAIPFGTSPSPHPPIPDPEQTPERQPANWDVPPMPPPA